jgi:hypothetical protein
VLVAIGRPEGLHIVVGAGATRPVGIRVVYEVGPE